MQLDLKASTSEEENLTDYYIILRTLGKGTFAEVKLAYHLHTQVQVAIKILDNINKNDDNTKNEIDIVKMLDHPNIIQLFHIISTKAHTYMVMEHAARGDLVSHIEKVGCLQEQQAQPIFNQIVCAVHYCHEKGIAHRDIKLDNILLDGKGNIKLCDFGLAIRVASGQRATGFCGTLEYCAPELFTGSEYDAKAADIWSVGVVLYTMVTACFPFKAKTYSDMKEKMLNPKYYVPYTLSEDIVYLIDQLFTVIPERRPKICDIRQHPWCKDEEKFLSSSEAYYNNLNPSIVVAMWSMGYHPKDISDSVREKKFNNIMATYRILNHKSALNHTNYADALTAPSQKGVCEPVLLTFTWPAEQRVHEEKASRKKWSRSLSWPAILCFHQKGNKPPHTVPKCAPK
ncbi:sperm motility kinase X-like, partial [Sigmodon hispidus]